MFNAVYTRVLTVGALNIDQCQENENRSSYKWQCPIILDGVHNITDECSSSLVCC